MRKWGKDVLKRPVLLGGLNRNEAGGIEGLENNTIK